jgi:TP901 family phage tail tape measure protein
MALDFQIKVKVDPSDAKRASGEVEKSLGKVQSSATKLQTILTRTFGAVGIAVGVSGSIRLLADFGQKMSTVAAISNATGDQFERLEDRARELGATTRFSASQAADGMIFLSRAGFNAEATLATIGDTLRLAQAGALDLGRAADIASNILTGFRMSTDQAARVVDVLALAANSANTDVDQLGQAMKFVAPVSAGLGVSLELTAAAISALSDAGLQAGMAGTGLRRVLSTLEKPSSAQTGILNNLGVRTEEVAVSQVGLTAAMERLAKAGIDTGTALELFGQRGGPAFDVMVNSIPKIKASEQALLNAGGTAERVAEVMDDNLNGALLAVRSAFEELILSFGDLGPTNLLTASSRKLAEVLRWLGVNMGSVTDAAKIVGIALFVNFYKQGLLKATAGVRALGAAIAANPLGAILTVLTAITAALVLFRNELTIGTGNLATIGDVGAAAFESIEAALGQLFALTSTGFRNTESEAEDFKGNVGLAFVAILQTAAQVVDKLVGTFLGAIGAIIFGFNKIPKALGDIFFKAINGIISLTEGGINKILAALNRIPGVELDLVDFGRLNNQFAGGAYELGTTVKDVFLEGFNQSVVEDALLGVLDSADAKARERIKLDGPEAEAPITLGGPEEPELGLDESGGLFENYLAKLREEGELLRLTAQEHQTRQGILAAEDELLRKLTDTEKEQLASQLELNSALGIRAQLLDEITGPQELFAIQQEQLGDLLNEGLITQDQYNKKLQELKAGLIDLEDQGLSFGTVLSDAFQGAFSILEDVLKGGKANFQDFTASILADIAKIAGQKVMIKAMTGLGIPGFQHGGSFTVGGAGGPDSQVVAFRATPGERVDIRTPGQQGGQPQTVVAPPAQVRVVNVTDPNDVAEVLNSPQGEQIILNTISRNPGILRQAIS